jgi:cytochrome c oxidase subunit 4
VAERSLSDRTFVRLGVLLVALTCVPVAVSFAPLPSDWHIIVGLCVASLKASLVLLFFMHVLVSNRLTWCVLVVVAFWVGILFILTLSDYYTRGAIPFTPGH